MSTVNSKMTAIADEIRTLTNTTEPMGLDAMATNIETANTATTTQESLISQIQTALIGKAGSGGNNEPVETATVTNLSDKNIYCADLDNNIICIRQNQSITCKVPTLACISIPGGILDSYVNITGNHSICGNAGIWITGNISITTDHGGSGSD